MKRLWKAAVAATGLAMLAGPVIAATPAGATPPTGYGFDNTPHVIVGGGSDTTYRAQVNLTDLWNASDGCQVSTATDGNMNKCITNGSPEVNKGGSYQHDTVVQANPVGSGSGLASLRNSAAGVIYNGAVNTPSGAAGTEIDFGRSSRGPSGTELTNTTFWGYAQDGVEVTSFGARTAQIQAAASPAIPAADLRKIFNCTYTQWSQVPGLGIAVGGADDGPIVPWGMNTGSGTYATFRDYIRTTTGDSAFDPSTSGCDRKLSNGQFAPENDIKPLVNDPAALSTSATSADNPKNWIWWGSFGVLSAFPYTSNYTRSGTQVIAGAVPVNGVLPATNNILANTYPIGRTLYHVTKKTDADCPKTSGVCDFTGNPGPTLAAGGTDLNVAGATSGIGGSVREYTRWICRISAAQQGTDTFTGTNFFSAITAAVNKAGFTVVPVSLRTAGSRCQVQS